MQDVIYGIVFMSVVFGLAALVLTALDKLALKKEMSPTDRERFLARRSSRFHSGWAWAILTMAIIAIPIHALGIEKEPLWQRLLYSGLAGLVVLNFLLGRRNSGNQDQPEEHPSSDPNE
jgi:hypothetical protein